MSTSTYAVVGESVVLYLGLPLILGVLTRYLVSRRGGEAAMDRIKPGLTAMSILGLLFTLIVMFALKGDLILQRPGIVIEMAIPMSVFFMIMFFVVLFVGWRLHFAYADAVAVAFSATGRDFEIAIAIAITAFSPTVALATVVGPLIEVPVMLFLVWAAIRLGPRWFKVTPGEAVRRAAGAPSRWRDDHAHLNCRWCRSCASPSRHRTSPMSTATAALFGDPVRAGILALLGHGPHCVCEMAAILHERENNVSNHLAKAARAGLVRASRQRSTPAGSTTSATRRPSLLLCRPCRTVLA